MNNGFALNGVETINGSNYFNVLDPHRDNPNYSNDGTVIDVVKDDGIVTAKASLFTKECDEFWIFSTTSTTTPTNDELVQAKINLEKLGYSGLRNALGAMVSNWDTNMESAVNKFLSDYGLTSNYDANNKTQLYVWISQAVKGQITKVNNNDGGLENGTNKDQGEVVNLKSVTWNFMLGISDAGISTMDGIIEFLEHPIFVTKQALDAIGFMAKALDDPFSEEGLMLASLAVDMALDIYNNNANEQARLIGRCVGEILLSLISDKGISKFVEAVKYLKIYAASGKLANAFDNVVSGVTKYDNVVAGVDGVRKAVEKLKYTLRYSIDELGYQVQKVISRVGSIAEVELAGGFRWYIDEVEDVAEAARPKYSEIIDGIWKYSGKNADEIADFYFSKVANKTKVSGKFSGSASDILRAELKDSGVITPPYKHQAHHIIPAGDGRFPAAGELREIMDEFGVDINSASNGVFLPDKAGYPHAGNAAVHNGSHTEAYYKYVLKKITDANLNSADDAVEVLNKIRKELLNGTISPNM